MVSLLQKNLYTITQHEINSQKSQGTLKYLPRTNLLIIIIIWRRLILHDPSNKNTNIVIN